LRQTLAHHECGQSLISLGIRLAWFSVFLGVENTRTIHPSRLCSGHNNSPEYVLVRPPLQHANQAIQPSGSRLEYVYSGGPPCSLLSFTPSIVKEMAVRNQLQDIELSGQCDLPAKNRSAREFAG
jgi:hypothetical protein